MKQWPFIQWMVIIIMFVSSCGGGTTEHDTPAPADPSNELEVITRDLEPVVTQQAEGTLVEFLIDNSKSVEKECNDSGKRRYDFVNFILSVFRTIPEPYSQSLYIGVGSFGNAGNDEIDYKPMITPMSVNPSFPSVDKPANINGESQSFSVGIQRSIDTMYNQPAERRYLILLTDGKFTPGETASTINAELGRISDDENFSVVVALICPEALPLYDDIKIWDSDVVNIDVFSMEDALSWLFARLQAFLPNTIAMSPNNYQSTISLAGYYLYSTFWYWSIDPTTFMNIQDLTAIDTGNYLWEVASGGRENPPIQPMKGCPAHNFSINSISTTHWFLLIQPRTFQKLTMSMRSLIGGPIEIVSNIPTKFQVQIDAELLAINLGDRKDCFSVQMNWKSSSQNGDVILANCVVPSCPEDTYEKLYYQNENEWIPPFSSAGDVEIKIRFGALSENNGIVWESDYIKLPIKFKAEYDIAHSTLPQETLPLIMQRNFAFKNVTSPTELNIYLVSDLDDLDDKKCPYPEIVENPNVHKLNLEQNCNSANLSNENSVCISFSSLGSREYIYTFLAYNHIISDCQYDQIYFDWIPNEGTKETIWWCDSFHENISCSEISRPNFLQH